MTPEEKRRKRLEELAKKLKGDDKSLNRTLGWGSFRWGCRVERVREYLAVLEMAGLIEVYESDGVIRWVG